MPAFTSAAVSVLLGADHPAVREGRVLGVQCLSGTGGLRLGAEFLAQVLRYRTVYLSSPTWDVHGEWIVDNRQ